jgi:hypothetical protein
MINNEKSCLIKLGLLFRNPPERNEASHGNCELGEGSLTRTQMEDVSSPSKSEILCWLKHTAVTSAIIMY